jgi:hypothetical protein
MAQSRLPESPFCFVYFAPNASKQNTGQQQPRLPSSRPQRSCFAPIQIGRVTREEIEKYHSNAESPEGKLPHPAFPFSLSTIQARCGTSSQPLLPQTRLFPSFPQRPFQCLPSASTRHGCPGTGDDPQLPTGRSPALYPDQHGMMGQRSTRQGRIPHPTPSVFRQLFFLFLPRGPIVTTRLETSPPLSNSDDELFGDALSDQTDARKALPLRHS